MKWIAVCAVILNPLFSMGQVVKMKKYLLRGAHVMGLLMISALGLHSPILMASDSPESAVGDSIFATRSQEKPRIDGILNDKTWKTPIDKEYIEYYPVYGGSFAFGTVAWLAYDDENLYFAFLCKDPAPGKIKTSMTKRDDIFNDDWIGIALDTLGTGQTAYCFYVNPSGIQGDSIRSAASRTEDFSPDFVWESAGRLMESGYQVEISIPLRSITYKSGKTSKMGVLFWRRIDRTGAFGSWPERKPGQQVFDNQAPVIYENLKKSQKLELLPSITFSKNDERLNPQKWGKSDNSAELGIGLKYGLTSSVTLDLAVRPDFSQVESDAYQVEVNQRYPLFYDEKRPFFMEGLDIFNVFTIQNGFFPNAVHTRRIVDPVWGAKLTGTVGKASLGILAAGDEYPGQAWNLGTNLREDRKALFGIVRGKYSLGRDNYVGFIYAGRGFAGEDNQVIGADAGHWLFKNQKINLSLMNKVSDGEISRSAGRDFAPKSNINVLYTYSTKPLQVQVAFEHIGKDFRMDTAYLKRTGIDHGWGEIKYNFFPNFSGLPWLKMISPRILFQLLHDLHTDMNDRYLTTGLQFRLLKEGTFNLDVLSSRESWQGAVLDTNQIRLSTALQPTRWLKLSGTLICGDKINYEGPPPYRGKGTDGDFMVAFRFNKNLYQQINLAHSELSGIGEEIYNMNLVYSKTTFQANKYLFFRAIFQFDSHQKRLLTDFLASFTFVPGTVIHLGYGGLYEKRGWHNNEWLYREGNLLPIKGSLFLKASYRWRI